MDIQVSIRSQRVGDRYHKAIAIHGSGIAYLTTAGSIERRFAEDYLDLVTFVSRI
jgi:hypothetical protein